MMPSLYGVTLPGPTPMIYASDSSMQDYISKPAQQAPAAPRRLSRGSNGQAHAQRPNMSMRIAKPSSANNSPRSSILAGRRRTLMNSGDLARKRQQALDQAAAPLISTDYFDTTRAARPVSWHPGSHLAQAQLQVTQPASQYPFPAFNDAELFQAFPHFSPTPATYSCNTSPSATFSPLSLPFPSFEGAGYPAVEGWNLPTQTTPSYVSSASDNSSLYEPFPALPAAAVNPTSVEPSTSSSSAAATQWHSFAMHGFNSTSPPTPETLPPAQQAQPGVPSEESIPYQALEEPEEEGEILVGMGLYDAPAKYDSDPQLDNYRSTMSQLLGSALRSSPSMGKGLKLEESWEPPPDSDDEEDGDGDDDDDDDADADGEAQQEQKSAPVASTSTTITNWV